MKNVLKLGLAVLAAATLAACGDGGSSDVADTYVGNWKSKCFKGTGNDGNTYYYINNLGIAKASAAELSFTGTGTSHSDAACSNKLSTFDRDAIKINLGAKTTFLGAQVDSMVYTIVRTGEARQGFIVADTNNMNVVIYNNDGSPPTGWGTASPYTKQ